jgi:Cu-Zn family superoxide dismutase
MEMSFPYVNDRRWARVAVGALATLAACNDPATAPNATLTAPGGPSARVDGGPLPTRYVLPGSSVFPEGIAYDERTQLVFVSSTTDGTIFRGSASDETLTPFLPPGADGRTTAVGLEVDSDGHLFVAGGQTGFVWVYDELTGDLIAALQTGSSPTFINDIAVDKDGIAYITDSMSPVIYRARPNGSGGYTIERWLELAGSPIVYGPGFNLNGIVVSPSDRYLFTVQTNTGKIYRIDIATKDIVQLDVGGATFVNGDGLWIRGNTLYVLQNQQAIITEIRVQPNQARGTVVSQTTDPSFAVPTSLVGARGRLLVVNSQFNRRGPGLTPVLPFTVSVVAIP